MFTRALCSILLVSFFAVGCASKKPAQSPDSAAATDFDASNSGLSLELNGDSDSSTAGGLVTVYFAFNSSQLSSSTLEQLRNNVEFLTNNASVDIQIEGHADERGGIQYNLALGEKRAKTVRDYLVANGISSNRISVISYGKERPVAEGNDESSWSKNRRANFVITAK
ncbi:MAG TPA: peptidoglycan-associated lipoprotein Pal [Bacteriovoracaceae bacterium]|nr:peptidoglycan-associated lipoprotein Pal [Bacteriovoracaceae bacterium]